MKEKKKDFIHFHVRLDKSELGIVKTENVEGSVTQMSFGKQEYLYLPFSVPFIHLVCRSESPVSP